MSRFYGQQLSFYHPINSLNGLEEGHEGPKAGSFLFTLRANNAAAGLGVYDFREKSFPSETLLKQKPDTLPT